MISARLKAILRLFVLLILLNILSVSINKTEASIVGCTASVTPSDSQPNVSLDFQFTITNNDSSNSIKRIEIYKPHPDIILSNYAIYPAWSAQNTGDAYVFTVSGTPLAPGTSISPRLTVDIGDLDGASGSWAVDVSDDAGGSGMIPCSGNLDLTIAASATDVTAPEISSVTASGITTTSAIISWTTNEASTSRAQYDVNAQEQIYPFSANSTQLVTSHSLTITQSIAPGTTYYYRVCSTDGSGNERCSAEYSFTTSAVASTSTPTPRGSTVVATATPTPAFTPSPTPVVVYRDTTPPIVTINTDLSKPFEIAPEISGAASENHSILAEIVYSTDGGQNWLPVQFIEKPNTAATAFKFTPQIYEDGNYVILVRATDSDGNKGMSKSYTVVIDRLPPSVGGNLLALGPQILQPEESGVVINMVGLQQRIVMSAIGGPTAIDLLVGEQKVPLSYSAETSLWYGFLSFDLPGFYQLKAQAVDGAGNKTERDLNPILVVESGRVLDMSSEKNIPQGEIIIYYQEPQSKVWTVWDGEAFGQKNPQKISQQGTYEFFIPSGTYYLQITSPGYNTLTSQIFVIEKPTPLNATFKLKEARHITIGPFTLSWPDFSSDRAEVLLFSPGMPQGLENELLEKDAPSVVLPSTDAKEFNLLSMRGQASVVSFISTWSPPAIEQISVIDQAVNLGNVKSLVISSQETASKVSVFRKRGGYQVPILVDRDGTLVESYGITSLPSHFFLDRNGKVVMTKVGVLSREEIEAILSEIP
jgi:peroxiredoxin